MYLGSFCVGNLAYHVHFLFPSQSRILTYDGGGPCINHRAVSPHLPQNSRWLREQKAPPRIRVWHSTFRASISAILKEKRFTSIQANAPSITDYSVSTYETVRSTTSISLVIPRKIGGTWPGHHVIKLQVLLCWLSTANSVSRSFWSPWI